MPESAGVPKNRKVAIFVGLFLLGFYVFVLQSVEYEDIRHVMGRHVVNSTQAAKDTVPKMKDSASFSEGPHRHQSRGGNDKRISDFSEIRTTDLFVATASPAPEEKVTDVTTEPPCKLQKLDPWNPDAMRHFLRQQPLECKPVLPNLITYHAGSYVIDRRLMTHQNGLANAECKYRFVLHRQLDRHVAYTEWKNATGMFIAEHDVMQLVCRNGNYEVLNKTYLHAVPKSLEQRNENRERRKRPILEPPSQGQKELGQKYNVVMIMVDGTSRSNFIRQFPLSYLYMMESMNGVDFSRHAKIGENTEPNILYGLLTGYDAMQFDKFPNTKGPYDDWPFVIYDFEEKGYVTMMSEDWDRTSLFVQYEGNGFWVQPFTHYARPFWLNIWNSRLKNESTKLCYDGDPFHNISFGYMTDFLNAYPGTPKFALVLIEKLTHNSINSGGLGDQDLWYFLQQVNNHRDDTFVFLFSDHGNRYSPFRQTKLGRIESNLPIFTMSIPTKFDQSHPNLADTVRWNAANAGITTVFDAHETLQDIVHGFDLSRSTPKDKQGISFFRKLPTKRTCSEAGVPVEFCICLNDFEIDPASLWLSEPANAVLSDLNLMLRAYKECEQLTLKKVTRALLESPGPLRSNLTEVFLNPLTKVVITLVASPSDAVLEANVAFNKNTGKFRAVGFSSRLDSYAEQSHCIQNSALVRTYCYCKEQTYK